MTFPSLRKGWNLSLLFASIFLVSLLQDISAHPASQLRAFKRDATNNSAVTLISIEREPTPDGNKFTVRFTKNVDDLIYRVQDNVEPPRQPNEVTETGGVWAASFVMPVNRGYVFSSQWFIMGDQDYMHMVAINLENSESTPAQQTVAELPVIHVIPASVAVYGPQEDVVVTAFVPRNSQTGEVVNNFRKIFTGVDLNTMQMHTDLDDDDVFTMGYPQESEDRIQANMTIHTSTRPLSGYLQLSTDVYNTGGNLASFIQVSRSILVKPANQAGPYPDGYLTILGGFSSDRSPNGNELHRCSVGRECLIVCASVGSSISDMEVKEIQSDGRLLDVPSAVEDPGSVASARHVYWKFHAREDSGDSDGITTFRCEARDDNYGRVETKMVDVLAEIEGSVDQESSTVTVEDDPTDPTAKIVRLQCAIRGRPLPDVVFFGGSTYVFNIFADSPDSVITVSQNEAIATKAVTVDAHDLTGAIQRISEGCDTGPSCSAYSHGNSDSYNFEFTSCK